ncbi:MAG: acyltransferase [Tepidisphaeraceae bacterium]|jgi:peptidoglycan/LPS O-acetylase OafA/YrhL
MTDAAVKSRPRLHGVDALRGLAASAVVVHHVVGINGLEVPRSLHAIPDYFGYAVPLFFVISTFSLCYTYDGRFDGTVAVRNYLIRRFMRIAPLFYCMLAVWVLTDLVKFHQPVSIASLLANLTLTFNLVGPYQYSIVWAGWSIGVEFVDYFVFPIMLSAVRGLRASVALLLFALLAAYGFQNTSPAQDDAVHILTHLPFFSMGYVAYYVYRKAQPLGPRWRQVLGVGALAAAFVFIVAVTADCQFSRFLMNSPLRRTQFYCLGAGLATLVLAQALLPTLSNVATRFLGETCYSIYLLHPWMIMMLKPAYAALAHVFPNMLVYVSVATILTFAVLLPLAWLTNRFIEKPAMAWGRRMTQRSNPHPAAPIPVAVNPQLATAIDAVNK